jgi:hypothetical protein
MEPEPQGAETFDWSRSRKKVSAPAPGSNLGSNSDTGIHTLILFTQEQWVNEFNFYCYVDN